MISSIAVFVGLFLKFMWWVAFCALMFLFRVCNKKTPRAEQGAYEARCRRLYGDK